MSSQQTSPPSTVPLVKLVLIGDMGTGKSSLMHRFMENDFVPSFTFTVGADYRQKVVQVKGKDIKLQIFDTAGQERFFSITKAYFRGAHGVLLVYDITSMDSLERLVSNVIQIPYLHLQRREGKGAGHSAKRPESSIRKRGPAVPTAKAQEVADQFGFKLTETSAKCGNNVDEVFMGLLEDVLNRINPQNEPKNVLLLSDTSPPKNTDKCSC